MHKCLLAAFNPLAGICSLAALLLVPAMILRLNKTREVYAGRRGLWEALDRPVAPRPLKGVLYCALNVWCVLMPVGWECTVLHCAVPSVKAMLSINMQGICMA